MFLKLKGLGSVFFIVILISAFVGMMIYIVTTLYKEVNPISNEELTALLGMSECHFTLAKEINSEKRIILLKDSISIKDERSVMKRDYSVQTNDISTYEAKFTQ